MKLLWTKERDSYLSKGSQASIIMSPEKDPRYLLERSIKLVTLHYHHPVKCIILYTVSEFVPVLLEQDVSWAYELLAC
jgi:hypothetical protein